MARKPARRTYQDFSEALNITVAMRASIPAELLQDFDQKVTGAEALHAAGSFQASGRALRAARMLQPAFAQAAADKGKVLGEARVAAKRAAVGVFKVCTKCKKRKRSTSFHHQRTGLHGWEYKRSVCKKCALNLSKAWKKDNPEQSELNRKRDYARNHHRTHLKRRFGLTPEEFDALFATSDGTCGICKKPEPRKRRLSLDHDHATGRLRGFLCGRCNLLLGYVIDNPDILEMAATYLRSADLGAVLMKIRSELKECNGNV